MRQRLTKPRERLRIALGKRAMRETAPLTEAGNLAVDGFVPITACRRMSGLLFRAAPCLCRGDSQQAIYNAFNRHSCPRLPPNEIRKSYQSNKGTLQIRKLMGSHWKACPTSDGPSCIRLPVEKHKSVSHRRFHWA